jgi:glycosyltransferase involved in cell wall biosynthesis
MRIAYISSDFGIPVYGNKGASIHVRELSAALAAQGHSVEILTCRAGGDAPAGFDIPVHEFPLETPERRTIGTLQDDPDASDALVGEVRAMLFAATFRYRALPWLRDFQPDAIYERYSLLATAGIELARELGVPHILEVNAPLSEEAARHRGIGFARTVRAVEQRILGATDRVIAVSAPLKEWIVGAGVEAERVTVAPNGVNIDRFAGGGGDLRRRYGIDDRTVVGFVGTLKAWHGTATLIRAIAHLAQERGIERAPYLLIVGDGPQRADLEAMAASEGIAGLTIFTGTAPHDVIPGCIAAMDVAVAPYDASPDFYFSPLKLFEYMAAGRPVVAAGIGQIVECLRDGETGLLYSPGDIAALAQRIGRLVDEPAFARQLGEAARAEAIANRGWERNARIVTGLIDRELSHRAAPILQEETR